MKTYDLEKGEDGIYRISNRKDHATYHHTKHNVHEVFIEQGEKLSNFLEKANKLAKTAMEISKIISSK